MKNGIYLREVFYENAWRTIWQKSFEMVSKMVGDPWGQRPGEGIPWIPALSAQALGHSARRGEDEEEAISDEGAERKEMRIMMQMSFANWSSKHRGTRGGRSQAKGYLGSRSCLHRRWVIAGAASGVKQSLAKKAARNGGRRYGKRCWRN